MEQIATVSLKELDYYHMLQPIMDITSMQILGFEMLLRSEQINNPAVLFQQAKLQHQMYELDMYSIQLALQTIKKHKQWFKKYHTFINILPATLSKAATFHEINRFIQSSSGFENKIVFEITEDASESELVLCKATLAHMKREGYLIAIDDLGTGDSTLSGVRELKPHVIKLDRLFAKDLATSPKKQEQIKYFVHLFREDKLLILEGVETEADLKMAEELGIRYVQGFHLGKPKRLHYYQERNRE